MLVSHRKQFIFTKTAKTAGTSVESYFEPFCMPPGEWEESQARAEHVSESGIVGYRGTEPGTYTFWNHMPAASIRDQVGAKVWDTYYKFTVVRNPFAKLVSGWYHFHRPNVTWKSTAKSALRDAGGLSLVLSGKKDIHDFRTWIAAGGRVMDRDKYLIDGEVCVDFFIRYESLEADIVKVNKRLGLIQEGRTIPSLNAGIRSRRFDVPQFYDARTEAIVRKTYAFEVEYFGYELVSCPTSNHV